MHKIRKQITALIPNFNLEYDHTPEQNGIYHSDDRE
jgi:hypothetical protein